MGTLMGFGKKASEQMSLGLGFGTLGDCGVLSRASTEVLSIFLILSTNGEKEYNSISLRQGVQTKNLFQL